MINLKWIRYFLCYEKTSDCCLPPEFQELKHYTLFVKRNFRTFRLFKWIWTFFFSLMFETMKNNLRNETIECFKHFLFWIKGFSLENYSCYLENMFRFMFYLEKHVFIYKNMFLFEKNVVFWKNMFLILQIFSK